MATTMSKTDLQARVEQVISSTFPCENEHFRAELAHLPLEFDEALSTVSVHLYEIRKDKSGALLDATPVLATLANLSRLRDRQGADAYARALKRATANALAWVQQWDGLAPQLAALPDLRRETPFQIAFGDLLAFGRWPVSIVSAEALLEHSWQTSASAAAELIALAGDKHQRRTAALSVLRALAPSYATEGDMWKRLFARSDDEVARDGAMLPWPAARDKAAFAARAALMAALDGAIVQALEHAAVACQAQGTVRGALEAAALSAMQGSTSRPSAPVCQALLAETSAWIDRFPLGGPG